MKTHIVLDLDGTIADTQKIHQQIESDFLKSKGCIIMPEIIGIKYAGRSPQERISELLVSENISFKQSDIDIFVDSKDNIVIDFLQKGQIQLIPHTLEMLEYLHKKNYKIGLASGACREFINQFIKYFDLKNIIIASTSANEVENKKPHPDVFLSSFNQIEELYGKPEIKYVIGDGRSDIEGGYKSGAKTIWLNFLNKPKINDTYCNWEIQSLKKIENIL